MMLETSEEEQLLFRAGVSEVDNRVLHQGNVAGRYAIVPVDELVGDNEPDEDVIGFDSANSRISEQRYGVFWNCGFTTLQLLTGE